MPIRRATTRRMTLRSAKLKVGSKVKRARDARATRLLAACKRFKFVK